jgi:hypothetical protein
LFRKILLGPAHGSKGETDPGTIAEAILFYADVRWAATTDGIAAFVRRSGPDALEQVVTSRYLKISFYPQYHSLLTIVPAGVAYAGASHMFLINTHVIAGNIPKCTEDYLVVALRKAGLNEKKAKRCARKLAPYINLHTINEDFRNNYSFILMIRELLEAKTFTSRAAQELLRVIAPDYPLVGTIYYNLNYESTEIFKIDTNIDFTTLNRICRFKCDGWKPWNAGYFASEIMMSIFHSHISSKFLSPLLASESVSALIRSRYMRLYDSSLVDLNNIELFQTTVVKGGRTIRESINNKAKSFSDFMKLMEEAGRFKDWISSQADDAQITQEYVRSLSALSWMDKMPSKIFRFVVANLVGLSHPIIGVNYSAADTFLIDNIVKGWRPSMFIDNHLSEFTSK